MVELSCNKKSYLRGGIYDQPDESGRKNIVVTGAASGIGKAMAKRLRELGAFLILIDNNGEKLNAVKNDISDNVKCICCDLTDFDTV